MSMEKDYEKFKEWHSEYSKNEIKIPLTENLRWCKDAWDACAEIKNAEIEELKNELKSAISAHEHLSSEYRNLDKSLGEHQRESDELKKRVEELKEKLGELLEEKEKLQSSEWLSREWYACRYEKLKQILKGSDFENRFYSIMANGTDSFGRSSPPDYAAILNIKEHEIELLRKKFSEAAEVIEFYADKNNWEAISGHTKFMSNLKIEDCAFFNCGGGRARAYLKGAL